jgi:putative phosphoribosyl transferase
MRSTPERPLSSETTSPRRTVRVVTSKHARIPAGDAVLDADVDVPDDPIGVVVFAHGSGSSRHSPRNRAVADVLRDAGLATVLADLLTAEEEEIDRRTADLRFDIGLLADRVVAILDWLPDHEAPGDVRTGLFGASTGAAAALVAAARRPDAVHAVVSRGGRPDLAGAALEQVRSPTLLIVGSLDEDVLDLNRHAAARMVHAEVRLKVVPGASHLFEEANTLADVAALARTWFISHLAPNAANPAQPSSM